MYTHPGCCQLKSFFGVCWVGLIIPRLCKFGLRLHLGPIVHDSGEFRVVIWVLGLFRKFKELDEWVSGSRCSLTIFLHESQWVFWQQKDSTSTQISTCNFNDWYRIFDKQRKIVTTMQSKTRSTFVVIHVWPIGNSRNNSKIQLSIVLGFTNSQGITKCSILIWKPMNVPRIKDKGIFSLGVVVGIGVQVLWSSDWKYL